MNVQISEGLRIDDAFAARLVDHMLKHLSDSADRLRDNMGKHDYRSSLGNPKGQRRIYNRLIRSQHSGLLAARLDTGTRMRFSMALDLWDATPAGDDAKGPLAWLVGSRQEFHSLGPNRLETQFQEMIALSRHALERLVQRGAARTPEDFIQIMRRAWVVLSLALCCLDRLPKDGTAWVVPVALANGSVVLLPIVRHTGKGPLLMVPTALTNDMGIDETALHPLLDLLAEYEAKGEMNKLPEDPRLPEAFAATVRATRKGRRQA